jgi:voltage-gated potassium channel
MIRDRLSDLLDGRGTAGRWTTLVINGAIVVSAAVIALESLPGLPLRVQAGLRTAEMVIVALFLAEYLARLWSARERWRYALSFWGLVDLAAVLPALLLLAPDWTALRLMRLIRLVKLFRAEGALARLARALGRIRGDIAVFGFLAAVVLYLSAVGIYHFEHEAQPEAFRSIPGSLWWAVATLTTVGYGDAYPITTGGRIFTTFVLLLGLGIVAVPVALVTAALLREFREQEETEKRTRQENDECD